LSVVSVVLSGRGLCDELITRPEESYRLCCVVVCDLETSRMGAPYIYDISRLRVKEIPRMMMMMMMMMMMIIIIIIIRIIIIIIIIIIFL